MSQQFIKLAHNNYDESEMLERSRSYYMQMDGRRSVREYSDKPVAKEIIENIIMTASSAPSGAHKQPWMFCAISNASLKHKIREAAEEEDVQDQEEEEEQKEEDQLPSSSSSSPPQLPPPPAYGTKQYWEDRYKKSRPSLRRLKSHNNSGEDANNSRDVDDNNSSNNNAIPIRYISIIVYCYPTRPTTKKKNRKNNTSD